MNDYISKESVNRIILEAIRYCDNRSDQTDDLTLKFSWDKCSGMLESVKESIDNITSTDVRPVAHGGWIFDSEWWDYVCTNCKGRVGNSKGYDFCPNCGADMRKENNNESNY